jgi:hypothetical protein
MVLIAGDQACGRMLVNFDPCPEPWGTDSCSSPTTTRLLLDIDSFINCLKRPVAQPHDSFVSSFQSYIRFDFVFDGVSLHGPLESHGRVHKPDFRSIFLSLQILTFRLYAAVQQHVAQQSLVCVRCIENDNMFCNPTVNADMSRCVGADTATYPPHLGTAMPSTQHSSVHSHVVLNERRVATALNIDLGCRRRRPFAKARSISFTPHSPPRTPSPQLNHLHTIRLSHV